MFRELRAPLSVHWEVTSRCNESCIHCYNYWNKSICETMAGYGERAERITEELIACGVMHVVITGGEPLLVLDGILPHIAALRRAGVAISLNSNLTLFTRGAGEKLRDAGVGTILVSLPASGAERFGAITGHADLFPRVAEGIRLSIEMGFRVVANMVVSTLNLDDIGDTARLACSLGVETMSVTRAVKPAGAKGFDMYRLTKAQFESLPDRILAIGRETGMKMTSIEGYPHCAVCDSALKESVGFDRLCMAGKTFCAMDMDMNLRPCPLIGETYQGGIRKAWQAMRKYRDDSLLPAVCAGCIRHSVCGGGCKAEASASCGGMDRVDPYANVGSRSLLEPLTGPREFLIADGMYRLDPHLLYREEDFGGLLYLDTARYLPVGKQLYRFCIENRECGFSLAAALNNIKADPQGLRRTMGYLLSQGFLQAAQRKMDSYVEFFR